MRDVKHYLRLVAFTAVSREKIQIQGAKLPSPSMAVGLLPKRAAVDVTNEGAGEG